MSAPTPRRQRDGSKPGLMQPNERLMRLAVRLPGETRWRWFFWVQVDGTSIITALIAAHPTAWEVDARWQNAYARLRDSIHDERALERDVQDTFAGNAATRWCFAETPEELEAQLAALNTEDGVPDLSTLDAWGERS